MLSLLEDFIEYVLDVWLVRRVRNKRGLPENSIAEDATKVAGYYVWVLMTSLVASVAILMLIFLFDWPAFWAIALITVPLGVYAGIKFVRLMRH